MDFFDIVVVGAGHAGIEAANAGASMGAKVLLLNLSRNTIGVMSCNPAIGGLAKGHLAREVDALGGIMGKAIDATGIQFRMLNLTKGPAVWGPRAQADKSAYNKYMTNFILNHDGITFQEDGAANLIFENNRICGIETESKKTYKCGAVILTTGTFLNGVTHRGHKTTPEGRIGERPSLELAAYLRTLNLEIGRLKTGTPARLHKDSLDYSKMQIQNGDDNPSPFSYSTIKLEQEQVPCYLTHTTQETKNIVLNNLHLSALYGGKITGIGPRYCPSIEDKYVKFKDKERHLLFIEPEGLDTNSIYINGASSSLPENVQDEFIHSIVGLENALILQYAYAIEYDFVKPTELYANLETKKYENLFLAGQINGTSGYEEAAAQGIMAGINAVLKLGGKEPFILKRSEAYTGVLIDDLVTKGVDEPYRMFTSRAEHRMMLRQDTADKRLTPYGYNLQVAKISDLNRMKEKYSRIEKAFNDMKNFKIKDKNLLSMVLTPEISQTDIKNIAPLIFKNLMPYDEVTLFADIKYEGYIKREMEQISKMEDLDNKKIPSFFDFLNLHALRIESREKLNKIRPYTIGQARNIPGVSPADIQILYIAIEKNRRSN